MSSHRRPQPEDDIAGLLKALAHPARLEIVRLTSEDEVPAGDLADRLDLPQAVTSQHLRVLRDSDLVLVRKDGNRRLYRINFARAALIRDYLDGIWVQGIQELKRAAEKEHQKRIGCE